MLLQDLVASTFPGPSAIIGPCLLPYQGKMIIAGDEKIGKSYLVTRIMRDLATNTPLFDCTDFPIPLPMLVQYFEQEIGFRQLQGRFLQVFNGNSAACGQLVDIQSKDTSLRIDTDAGLQRVMDLAKAFKPQVMVFDPLAKFHRGDENSSQEMGALLKQFDILNAAVGASSILVHHYGKHDPQFTPQKGKRTRGSSIFGDDADAILDISVKSNNSQFRRWRVDFTFRHMNEPDAMIVKWDRLANPMTITFEKFEK